MFRALRLDKLTIAALEVTLNAYLRGALDEIPALRMIRAHGRRNRPSRRSSRRQPSPRTRKRKCSNRNAPRLLRDRWRLNPRPAATNALNFDRIAAILPGRARKPPSKPATGPPVAASKTIGIFLSAHSLPRRINPPSQQQSSHISLSKSFKSIGVPRSSTVRHSAIWSAAACRRFDKPGLPGAAGIRRKPCVTGTHFGFLGRIRRCRFLHLKIVNFQFEISWSVRNPHARLRHKKPRSHRRPQAIAAPPPRLGSRPRPPRRHLQHRRRNPPRLPQFSRNARPRIRRRSSATCAAREATKKTNG